MEKGLKLLAEIGGYSLYSMDSNMAIIPTSLLSKDNQLKVIHFVYPEVTDVLEIGTKKFPASEGERVLSEFIDYAIHTFDHQPSVLNGAGLSLAQMIKIQKDAREKYGPLSYFIPSERAILNRLPLGCGHDANQGQMFSNSFLAECYLNKGSHLNKNPSLEECSSALMRVHNSDNDLFIGSLPSELVSQRHREWMKYATFAHSLDNLTKGEKERLVVDARRGKFEEELIKEDILYIADDLGNEISRQESLLAILDYLKSRVTG